MTSADMGSRYIDEARRRVELVRLAHERQFWATVVREAQEAARLCFRLLEPAADRTK